MHLLALRTDWMFRIVLKMGTQSSDSTHMPPPSLGKCWGTSSSSLLRRITVGRAKPGGNVSVLRVDVSAVIEEWMLCGACSPLFVDMKICPMHDKSNYRRHSFKHRA